MTITELTNNLSTEKIRILVIGAHPDDADIKSGGTSALWCAAGHVVKLVSVCDGSAGHHEMWGEKLVDRRRAESQASGAVIGATYEILDQPDGRLQPTLAAREQLIRLIRSFRPDVLITHRTTDYHPDHCYTGLLVQEAAYLLTVPAICSDVPHLSRSPVILYFSDAFKFPCPFEPHVVVDIESVLDQMIDMLHCHQSQFYEWLPYNAGYLEQVPADESTRRTWLGERIRRRLQPLSNRYRQLVVQAYGPERGPLIQYIEAFQVSEFGSPLDDAARSRLFPFLPASSYRSSACVRKEWVDIPAH
ncbi:MAG: PIG-L family deacetylase [Pirellulaceae bacterium]|nr:PIG-L family deacetylase [Pirellulaceae bacterium]